MTTLTRRLTLALLATTLLAAYQSNTDDQTQTMLNERTEDSESQDNQQAQESTSDDQEQNKEESNDQTDQEGAADQEGR